MMIKKLFLTTLVLLGLIIGVYTTTTHAQPSPEQNFFEHIKNGSQDGSAVYDPKKLGIDSNKTLQENIKGMFYPQLGAMGGDNQLRNILKVVAGIIFFIFTVVIGSTFLLKADDDTAISNAKSSFLYLLYGGFLVFGSMRILGALNIGSSGGGADLVMNLRDKIIVNLVSFIKAGAFFIAIVLIIYHGLQIIRAYEKADKIAEARKAIINILGILILIKVVDYVYFIAFDTGFQIKAVELIIQISKLLGRGIGIISVLYLIYAGFMLVMGQGDSERFKKSTNIIKGIFFAVFIIFLFLLTTYQLFKDLG